MVDNKNKLRIYSFIKRGVSADIFMKINLNALNINKINMIGQTYKKEVDELRSRMRSNSSNLFSGHRC